MYGANEFNWFEYAVFFGMLSASAWIGIYFGLIKKAANTTEGYMLGGKEMPLIPIGVSLVSSFISGVSLLGIPAETYLFGTQHLVIVVDIAIAVAIAHLYVLPVTYTLGYTSIFEYLEKRFDAKLRKIGSAMFAIQLILHTPMVIYVPAIAFNQATGASIYIIAPLICAICIFYTSLGGLKAVVWSDALQALVAAACVIAVSIIGINLFDGGLTEILRINIEGERLEFFNMDPSLTARSTFWTVVVGQASHWITMMAVHPATHQRYISLPTYEQARKLTYLMGIGLAFSKMIIAFIGLIIYARYRNCDPVRSKVVSSSTQLFALMVADISRDYKGLTGLFLAGVVSTALSSMSAGLNTLSGTLYDDFIRPVVPFSVTERRANITMKLLVVIIGALCTSMVFFVERLGAILQVSATMQGITQNSMILIFLFGLFMPWINAKGAFSGALAAFVVSSIITFTTQMFVASGDIQYATKLISIENCPANLTAPLHLNSTTFGYTGTGTKVFFTDSVPWYLRMSYHYYGLPGVFVGILIGFLVSYMSGGTDFKGLDPKLVIPQVRFLFPKQSDGDKLKTFEPAMELNGVNRREYKAVPLEEVNHQL